jgi:hypothetical protein
LHGGISEPRKARKDTKALLPETLTPRTRSWRANVLMSRGCEATSIRAILSIGLSPESRVRDQNYSRFHQSAASEKKGRGSFPVFESYAETSRSKPSCPLFCGAPGGHRPTFVRLAGQCGVPGGHRPTFVRLAGQCGAPGGHRPTFGAHAQNIGAPG